MVFTRGNSLISVITIESQSVMVFESGYSYISVIIVTVCNGIRREHLSRTRHVRR